MGQAVDYKGYANMQLSHWFVMGGYAGYIWSAYGLASLVLIGNSWVVRQHRQKIRKQISQYLENGA